MFQLTEKLFRIFAEIIRSYTESAEYFRQTTGSDMDDSRRGVGGRATLEMINYHRGFLFFACSRSVGEAEVRQFPTRFHPRAINSFIK